MNRLYKIHFLSGLGLFLITGSSACQSIEGLRGSDPKASLPASSLSPTLSPSTPLQTAAKPVVFDLTVDSPIDLKIKQGSFVNKGQVIADRELNRLNLEQQKKVIASQLASIETSSFSRVSTVAEQDAIALAQKQVTAAESSLREFKDKSPWTDFARSTLPLAQEEIQLNQLQKNLQIAQSNLVNAQQKLQQKQQAMQSIQQESGDTKAQLQQQLATVEQQLSILQPIKSAYTGTITKIQTPSVIRKGEPVKLSITLIPGTPPTSPSSSPSVPSLTGPGIPAPSSVPLPSIDPSLGDPLQSPLAPNLGNPSQQLDNVPGQ